MAAQVTGLVTSLALYLAAVWLFLHVQARLVQGLPNEWRTHPELREVYEPASSEGVRSVFSAPRKAEVSWLVGFVLAFAVLTATDFSVGFQLLFAVALALYWTIDEAWRNAEEAERLSTRHGLTRPAPGRWGWTSWLMRWAALFLVWLGYLGLACFGGGLLATPFD